MNLKRVVPCLLLKDAGLVKTVKFRSPTYVGDPLNILRIFNEKRVDEMLLLDIGASKFKTEPDIDLLKQLASECFIPLAYGGGVNSLDIAQTIISVGFEKVSLNSILLRDPSLLTSIANQLGSQSVIAAVDVKKNLFGKYRVYDSSCDRMTSIDPIDHAKDMVRRGAGEIFLNDVSRDGTMIGYDLSLLKQLTTSVSVPVIACGGAGRIQDLDDAFDIGGVAAASAGSLFIFQGKNRSVLINYPTR